MALIVYKYGSNSRRGQPLKHPNGWGSGGTGDNYEIIENKVLQKTDVGNNNNKFYALEKHKNGSGQWRLFSHYGRTGGASGTKECRYGTKHQIDSEFTKILSNKKKKGYCEVNLAKSNIGSEKARGQSAGLIDEKTLKALKGGVKKKKASRKKKVLIDNQVRTLVQDIYSCAGTALANKANVKITADGFETPLGVLTLGQVEEGFNLLGKIRGEIQSKNKPGYINLSSQFYTTIPHKLGKSRSNVEAAILNTIKKTDEAEDTLQLMKDMLEVNKATGHNLFANDEIFDKFSALKTSIEVIAPSDSKWKEIEKYVQTSKAKGHRGIKVHNIYCVSRNGETDKFNPKNLNNIKELFHGTRAQNVVGILTRGLLLPNMAKRHGARVTGAMFGPGLYFADASTKSANYCDGSYTRNKQYMFLAGVALGKMKQYTKATYITNPPKGFDSVLGKKSVSSARYNYLVNNEYIIYNSNQQELRYIIEFTRS